jgi:hypothetical protein
MDIKARVEELSSALLQECAGTTTPQEMAQYLCFAHPDTLPIPTDYQQTNQIALQSLVGIWSSTSASGADSAAVIVSRRAPPPPTEVKGEQLLEEKYQPTLHATTRSKSGDPVTNPAPPPPSPQTAHPAGSRKRLAKQSVVMCFDCHAGRTCGCHCFERTPIKPSSLSDQLDSMVLNDLLADQGTAMSSYVYTRWVLMLHTRERNMLCKHFGIHGSSKQICEFQSVLNPFRVTLRRHP